MDGSAVEGGDTCFSHEALTEAFARRLNVAALNAEQSAFVVQVQEDCGPGEFPGMSADDLAGWLADFWAFADQLPGAGPKIRLVPAEPGAEPKRDRLEIVQADCPFLVDSVMGELTDQGMTVRAMFHPIIGVARDATGRRAEGGEPRRESMIFIVLDPVGDDRARGLIEGVEATLTDVRAAVADYPAMQALLRRAVEELKAAPPAADPGEAAEEVAFLDWLAGERFVLLGARQYDYPRTTGGDYAAEEPLYEPEGSLGVLRDQSRTVLRRGSEPAVLTPQLKRLLLESARVNVAKSNMRSRVHRRVNADYVGVRRYGADGLPIGEVRFVGLFTAETYEEPVREVPLIRRKVAEVLRRSGRTEGGHSDKRLRHILETWSRDELFQMSGEALHQIATGVLHLYDRPRIKMFVRRDPYDRFFSIMLYVPRDSYNSGVRERAGRILAEAYRGRVSAYYPFYSDDPLARVHFIIGVTPGDHPEPDIAELEAEITETARTWEDRFEQAVRSGRVDSEAAPALIGRWRDAFPVGYRDRNDAEEALVDIEAAGAVSPSDPVRVRAFRDPADAATAFRFKLYRHGQAAPLSEVLPILEAMGLKALIEEGFPLRPAGADAEVWVHLFELEDPRGGELVFDQVKRPFEETFEAVWNGRTESDGFNRLVLELGVGWREAGLIRALSRYRGQSGLDPSQQVQEAAFADFPAVTRLILQLFAAKFDPATGVAVPERTEREKALAANIVEALQAVPSLDADRVLRRVALVVQAMKRTNFYQLDGAGRPKPYMSFKIASRELEDLPAPKPYREIWVWSPRVEGVHLRFGPVARGGLRWSDRRDDFRTEVLGLVKAQQVKNAVIVPVGSKGGFFPKQLPRGGDRDALQKEAIEAYKTFLSGLLDVTDNIDADNAIVHPPRVVIHEGDDPYLVVAADKGTATFSDIANSMSAAYGFWLGDAFASGGSVGYDHKAMGITARGAWEAVKRHFRELGKDIQSEPFTVVGVGDMSGDVFGNGMLLSKQIRLIAAFDHRDIFLDPDPDPAASWAERDRLFALPRSSWNDYDKALISAGGGVFSRALKSVPISAEVKAALDITVDALSPADLMRAILKARAELLYLGGIGTYVRGPSETDPQVGDKANDAIRVTGRELRVRVVGEGANLGLTQAGRIAYALAGGRLNTDAIDNSAGVDTSDHEVNIKILLGQAIRGGALPAPDREPLLASMTDDVAAHVLGHNYDQTLALSLMAATAARDLDFYGRMMSQLEAKGRLDRAVEGLPDAAVLAERQTADQGLTRPELAVLLAYAKLELNDQLVAGSAPDDPYFVGTLKGYFPAALGRFDAAMASHRLRREIISTVLANAIVNMAGATFPSRVQASAGVDAGAVAVAFEAARRVFRLDEAWDAVNALDQQIPANTQLALLQEVQLVLRRQTYWLARRVSRGDGQDVQELIDAYRPAADALQADAGAAFSPLERRATEARADSFIAGGAPEALARGIAALRPLTATAEIADIAQARGWPVKEASRVYHQTGAVFHLDRLRHAAHGLTSADHYERLAVRRLIEDVLTEQATIADAVMAGAEASVASGSVEDTQRAVGAWAREPRRATVAETARRTIDDIEQAGGGWSFAKLTIANSALRELAAAAR